mmetsp:Transcript_20300/g.60638  ORF Transcript_20300/g.60638 Transcript_20300/m.60638 type:complete len:568 (+) Transcript_20300:577-2280(+)
MIFRAMPRSRPAHQLGRAASTTLSRRCWPGRSLPHAKPGPGGVVEAAAIPGDVLEGVEGHAGEVPALLPVIGRVAVVLHEKAVVVLSPHVQHLEQALVDEEVLAPHAVAVAELPEVISALLRAARPGDHGIAREDLEGAVEAILAVVQIHALLGLRVHGYDASQALGEEDRVGIDLHRPVVLQEGGVLHDFLPDREEDGQVESGAELPSLLALEVAVHDAGDQALGHLDRPVAVDRVGVAAEEADTRLVLEGQQALLVAARQHQGEAVERHVGHARGLEGHVLRRTQPEPLVQVVLVAHARVERATIPGLGGVQAGPAPVRNLGLVLEVVPLLVPVFLVARQRVETAQILGAVRGEAETALVHEHAGLLREHPLLALFAWHAGHHLDQAPIPHRAGCVEAKTTHAPDDAVVAGQGQVGPGRCSSLIGPAMTLQLGLPGRPGRPGEIVRLEVVAVRPVRVARHQPDLDVPGDGVAPAQRLEVAHVGQAWYVLLLAPGPGTAARVAPAHLLALLRAVDVSGTEERAVRPEVDVVLDCPAHGLPLRCDLVLELPHQRCVHLLAALANRVG